jgi:hypothetical protein
MVIRARLNIGMWELLVKWTKLSEGDTTWETVEDFKRQFLTTELMDVLFVGQGEMLWMHFLSANTRGE